MELESIVFSYQRRLWAAPGLFPLAYAQGTYIITYTQISHIGGAIMRAVVQRVARASVTVDAEIVGSIGRGLLILLGVGENDSEDDIVWMANKILGLRIFPDDEDKMNLSVTDLKLEVLVISQFTLYGSVKKGFRPSFTSAASPEKGEEYYEKFIAELRKSGLKIEKGIFGAMMDVDLLNQGPVTIIIESNKEF